MAIYIFLLLFPGPYICSKASKFNSACASSQGQLVWFFFLSIHILRWSSLDIGCNKKRNLWFFNFILCQSELERPCDFIRTLTQLYRRSHRRYNCVFRFSTALRGGKLAVAALPPLSSAVSTAISSFPPLWEEANWQLQLYRLSHRR